MSFEKAMSKHKEMKENKEKYTEEQPPSVGLEDAIEDFVNSIFGNKAVPKVKSDTPLFAITINGNVVTSRDWVNETGVTIKSTKQEINFKELQDFRTWAWSKVGVKKSGTPDMVNHPEHYTSGGIETLDFIKEKLDSNSHTTPYQAYCFGNAMKYISRAGLKGDIKEDIKKAIFYLRSSIGDDPR